MNIDPEYKSGEALRSIPPESFAISNEQRDALTPNVHGTVNTIIGDPCQHCGIGYSLGGKENLCDHCNLPVKRSEVEKILERLRELGFKSTRVSGHGMEEYPNV